MCFFVSFSYLLSISIEDKRKNKSYHRLGLRHAFFLCVGLIDVYGDAWLTVGKVSDMRNVLNSSKLSRNCFQDLDEHRVYFVIASST